MRDIRTDLKERLESIKQECIELEERLASLKEAETMLTGLLVKEEELWASQQATLFEAKQDSPNGKYDSPVAKLVLETLREAGGTCSLSDLKKAAFKNRIGFGDKKPGRAIHFLLVGMEQNKIVEGLGEGKWKLVE